MNFDSLLMKNGRLFYTGAPEELVSCMETAVWHCTVPREEAEYYLKNYQVSNIKTTADGTELRILSKARPTADAVQEQATLEDAFLLYFGERAGDTIDVSM